jgi:hypothetical protein
MTQEGSVLRTQSGQVPRIEGQAAHPPLIRDEDCSKDGVLPQQAVKMLMELTEMRASVGPDPETARIIAETDRHAEEKKLEGYKATLEHRDKENERRHFRQLKKIRNENVRSTVVLVASIIAAVTGIFLAMDGKSGLGIPLLVFAGVLIKDLAGRPPSSADSD